MATAGMSRVRWVIVSGTALVALVFFGLMAAHHFLPHDSHLNTFYQAYSNIAQTISPWFAAACCVFNARKGKHGTAHRRMAWFLIGAGCFFWGVGQAIWTYKEIYQHIDMPLPSVADVFYLGGYPLLIVGMVLLLSGFNLISRMRQIIDSAIAASSVAMLSWYFVVEKLWNDPTSHLSRLGKIISVSYPIGDVAMIFTILVLVATAGATRRSRIPIAFMLAGIGMLSASDTLYVYFSYKQTYVTGMWIDPGWYLGFACIGFAALMPIWYPAASSASTSVTSRTSRPYATAESARFLLPYALAITSFVIVAVHDLHDGDQLHGSTYGSGAALMMLIIFRQVFTLLENHQLTVKLQGFNENLETMVTRRTQQLGALHQLAKAVNMSLDLDQVLLEATKHTRQALHADAVLIWLDEITITGEIAPRLRASDGLEEGSPILGEIEGNPMDEAVDFVMLPAGDGRDEGICLRALLVWKHNVLGKMTVIRWNSGFSPSDADLLESIGLEVGTAIENARLYNVAVEAADSDSVTGLLNHRAVHQRLGAELQLATRSETSLAVIMMDLNNFKLFNDTYGHPVGDQVLKTVARSLVIESRDGYALGRYGGDEFIAVLPDANHDEARNYAQRLKDRMDQEGYKRGGEERTIPVSMSFGIAIFPEDSLDRHELISIADRNLYSAKDSEEGIVSTSERERSHRELRVDSSFSVLDAMVTAVDNKDRYTRRHSEDVTEYALWIAEELGLSEETMRVIRIGGLLHDVGKIGVPDQILRKPGRLTQEEYDVLKRHPEIGALMVGSVPGMEAILDAVRSHHERWDGKGYPDGLATDDIPFLGRIMAIADAFSAMTTDRVYRKGMDWPAAFDEVIANMGTQFDPEIATAFLSAARPRLTPSTRSIADRVISLPRCA